VPVLRSRRAFIAFSAVLLIALVTIVAIRATGPSRTTAGANTHSTAPDPRRASPSVATAPKRAPWPIPGFLLIADRGNNRMLLVDRNHTVLWSYPRAADHPAIPFKFDDDVFFGALGSNYSVVISNQEDQQTIQIVSFPGRKILWSYGHVNVPGSARDFLHTPDDAYLLPNGIRTVADIRNCRILFISPSKKIVRQIGTTGVCTHDPPRSLAMPNGDTPLADGSTLVTEITGSWIDDISAAGKLMWSVHAPVRYPSDAQYLGRGRILVADYSPVGHVLIMNTHGRVLWSYGPRSGGGALTFPSLALMLPNGLVAVNDDARDRVVIIDPETNRIVWQYGHTDRPGTAPGFLHKPDGMDFLPFDVAMSQPEIRRLVGLSP
jgi:hypothetical protein